MRLSKQEREKLKRDIENSREKLKDKVLEAMTDESMEKYTKKFADEMVKKYGYGNILDRIEKIKKRDS